MIFKIASQQEWAAAVRGGLYEGSPKDRADGYLHFSTAAQLELTLKLYYAKAEGLLLLAVDEQKLGQALKWERAPSRGEDFPHLYAPLPVGTVCWTLPIGRDAKGMALIPDAAFGEF